MKYLTAPEIAARLNVSDETARRWCRSGEIPAIRIGRGRGSIRVEEKTFETWLSRQRKASA